ncbi:hypothetical protein CBL_00764 [Carabus blaptoides fortunei]
MVSIQNMQTCVDQQCSVDRMQAEQPMKYSGKYTGNTTHIYQYKFKIIQHIKKVQIERERKHSFCLSLLVIASKVIIKIDIITFKSDSKGDLDAIQIADNDSTRIMDVNIDEHGNCNPTRRRSEYQRAVSTRAVIRSGNITSRALYTPSSHTTTIVLRTVQGHHANTPDAHDILLDRHP